MVEKHEHDCRRMIERSLAAMSAINRPLMERVLRAKGAQGLKLRSQVHYARYAQYLDAHLSGRAITSSTPEEMEAFFANLAGRYSNATVCGASNYLKAVLNYLAGDTPLPKSLLRAFRIKPLKVHRELVSERDFALMVQACDSTRDKALLWVLWDSGFRRSEAVALNVGSFEFDGQGGATVSLPRNAPNLKTGPRTIYVMRCVPAIRALLLEHPLGDDPAAPLFLARDNAHRNQRLGLFQLFRVLRRALAKAGVDRRITPHSFRHTRATEAAVAGWNEAELRFFFGWSGNSRMPSHYVHYNLKAMRERVRRDARYIDPVPIDAARTPAPRSPVVSGAEPTEALARALAEILRRGMSADEA